MNIVELCQDEISTVSGGINCSYCSEEKKRSFEETLVGLSIIVGFIGIGAFYVAYPPAGLMVSLVRLVGYTTIIGGAGNIAGKIINGLVCS